MRSLRLQDPPPPAVADVDAARCRAATVHKCGAALQPLLDADPTGLDRPWVGIGAMKALFSRAFARSPPVSHFSTVESARAAVGAVHLERG